MEIGNLKIKGCAALAPMAGVADRAFRELCVSYGAAYVVSEMISSKGVSLGDRKSKALMQLSDEERPAGVQIFGNDPSVMAQSVKIVLGVLPDFVDINMGCPAPKIAGNGGGASLMRHPQLAKEIVEAAVAACGSVPVTVKIRSGWDFENLNAVEMAQNAENAGAVAVTVHGRTRQQMYAPPVDHQMISEVKKSVSIPVVGNGDIVDGPSAAKMLEETNCDFLMVGRGALGRPWVFSQINAYLQNGIILPEPPVSERMRVMVKHVRKICEYKGERIGIREARKHAAWYAKGIRGAAKYRKDLSLIESIEQLEELAFKITKENM
ncbi:MAG TPA: tRNA dihydrouridine synthase DusB [Candidatus Fimenecus excrementavium]|nr:tRNA dihydrouridine synthase DusB [Candidatus Fimenecus excrementavium]